MRKKEKEREITEQKCVIKDRRVKGQTKNYLERMIRRKRTEKKTGGTKRITVKNSGF